MRRSTSTLAKRALRPYPEHWTIRFSTAVAFSAAEREALGLPTAAVGGITLEEQARRAYRQLQDQESDLAKNVYLEQLHDRNETLYYKLLGDHLAELLPVVYDPTVGRRSRSTRTSTGGRAASTCR